MYKTVLVCLVDETDEGFVRRLAGMKEADRRPRTPLVFPLGPEVGSVPLKRRKA